MIKVKTFDVAIDIWTMLVQWIQNTLAKNLNKIRGSLENMTREFMHKIFKKYKMENMTADVDALFKYQTVKKFVMTWEKVIEEVELYLSKIWEEMLSMCSKQINAIIEEEEEEEEGRRYIPNPETIQKEERKMIKGLTFSEKQIILDMEGDVTVSNSVLKRWTPFNILRSVETFHSNNGTNVCHLVRYSVQIHSGLFPRSQTAIQARLSKCGNTLKLNIPSLRVEHGLQLHSVQVSRKGEWQS
jgi:hypothetical protein